MEREILLKKQEQLRNTQRSSAVQEHLGESRAALAENSDNNELPEPSSEQSHIIQKIRNGFNIKVIAAAGSGKTTTTLLIAKNIPSKKILLLTYNARLKSETKIKIPKYGIKNLECYNYHSLASKLFQSTCNLDCHIDEKINSNADITQLSFNILILDELQDMTQLLYRFCIFFLTKLNISPQFVTLGDPHQTIYKNKGADERYLTLAEKAFESPFPWETCSMQKSFRVTKLCADFINECCLSFGEKSIQSDKEGPKIRYLEVNGWYNENASKEILKEINVLMKEFGLQYGDIFVLAPSVNKNTPVVAISNELSRRGINVYVNDPLECASDLLFQGKIVFLSFHQVKGLERKAVIVLHFDQSYYDRYNTDGNYRLMSNELYVAVTRSSKFLTLVRGRSEKNLKFLNICKVGEFVDEVQDNQLIRNFNNYKEKKIPESKDLQGTDPSRLTAYLPYELESQLLKMLGNIEKSENKMNRELKLAVENKDLVESTSEITNIACIAYYQYKTQQKISAVDLIRNLIRKLNDGKSNNSDAKKLQEEGDIPLPIYIIKLLMSINKKSKSDKSGEEILFENLINPSDSNKINYKYYLDLINNEEKLLLSEENLVQDILILSSIFQGIKNHFTHKNNQIKEFNWLQKDQLFDISNSLDQLIGHRPKNNLEYFMTRKILYQHSPENRKKDNFEVFVDIYDKENAIWFVKNSSQISHNFYLEISVKLFLIRMELKEDAVKAKIFDVITNQVHVINPDPIALKTIIDMLYSFIEKNNKINDEAFLEATSRIRKEIQSNLNIERIIEEEPILKGSADVNASGNIANQLKIEYNPMRGSESEPQAITDHIKPSSYQDYIIKESLNPGKNLIVNSVAGSGKTTTSLFIAEAHPTSNILHLTYNARLKQETRQKIFERRLANITCHSYHSVYRKYFFKGVKDDSTLIKYFELNTPPISPMSWDFLIIDEIQDCNQTYFRAILNIIKYLQKIPKLIVLGDPLQSIYQFNDATQHFLVLADKIFPSLPNTIWEKVSLPISYRMTHEIAGFINNCMFDKEIIIAKKHGPKVRYCKIDAFLNVQRQVFYYLTNVGVKIEDIFVLAPSISGIKCPARRLANQLTEKNINIFVSSSDEERVDDEKLRGKLALLTFHQAKGLERRCVIVINFDLSYFTYYKRKDIVYKVPNTLYVAVTRAKEHLCLIHHKNNDFLPFMNVGSILNWVEMIEELSFNDPKLLSSSQSQSQLLDAKSKAKMRSVTELLKYLPARLISDCMDRLIIKKRETRQNSNLLYVKTIIETDKSIKEGVSEITAIAIRAFFEMFAKKQLTIMQILHTHLREEEIRNEVKPCETFRKIILPSEKNKIFYQPYFDYILNNDLNHFMESTEKSCEALLILTTIYDAYRTGYAHKNNQIQKYAWITPEEMKKFNQRLKETFPDPETIEFEKVEWHIFSLEDGDNFYLCGTIDIYDKKESEVWKIKVCEDISDTYFLEVALYQYLVWKQYGVRAKGRLFNIMTNEIFEIEYKSVEDLEYITLNFINRVRSETLEDSSETDFLESLKPIMESYK